MLNKYLKSLFEKVYIIRFKDVNDIPTLSESKRKQLGKWYVHSGNEWICHSDLTIFEFQQQFLQLSQLATYKVDFDVDYLPFSK